MGRIPTCSHAFEEAFRAFLACHDHRSCKEAHSTAHYALGCRLEPRAQPSLGIFWLPAP